ncbi:MAG: alpha/beta hydrolase [Anaerolineae bacterium]|nr:alpha/beta hydrolase [Anaerolineae bacterium]
MATLVTEQGIVHYEVYGRGRPVVLLHGWLNSWAVWRSTVERFNPEFRLYALDFLGFGESGTRTENYSVSNYVVMVNEFMERMAIKKAPLIGHSMGGTVALNAALNYPEKVVKVAVVGSPINGTSLSPLLRLAAYRGWVGLAETTPVLYDIFQKGFLQFLGVYSHFMARDGKRVGKMLTEDVSKLTAQAFFESIGTLKQTDLRSRVGGLKMPVLGMYGKKDIIVDPKQSKVLKECLPESSIAWFEHSGHFPMMDETERFHETVRDFLYNG